MSCSWSWPFRRVVFPAVFSILKFNLLPLISVHLVSRARVDATSLPAFFSVCFTCTLHDSCLVADNFSRLKQMSDANAACPLQEIDRRGGREEGRRGEERKRERGGERERERQMSDFLRYALQIM